MFYELLRIRFIGTMPKPHNADERIAGWAKTSGADLMYRPHRSCAHAGACMEALFPPYLSHSLGRDRRT